MSTFTVICASFAVNMLVGCAMWSLMDSPDNRLYKWVIQAPTYWIFVAVIQFWFVGAAVLFYYHVRETRKRRKPGEGR